MLGLMALVFLFAAQKRIGRYLSCLLVMAVFIDFNPVLFVQYLSWTVPLLLLCAADFAAPSRVSPQQLQPAQQ